MVWFQAKNIVLCGNLAENNVEFMGTSECSVVSGRFFFHFLPFVYGEKVKLVPFLFMDALFVRKKTIRDHTDIVSV